MLNYGFNEVEMKRTAISLILTLLMLLVAGTLFANLSSANFFPDPGPDLPRIYIRNDGSVEPATAPIERTGNLYKLTGNIVLYTIELSARATKNNILLLFVQKVKTGLDRHSSA
jgi:hypothetical protein